MRLQRFAIEQVLITHLTLPSLTLSYLMEFRATGQQDSSHSGAALAPVIGEGWIIRGEGALDPNMAANRRIVDLRQRERVFFAISVLCLGCKDPAPTPKGMEVFLRNPPLALIVMSLARPSPECFPDLVFHIAKHPLTGHMTIVVTPPLESRVQVPNFSHDLMSFRNARTLSFWGRMMQCPLKWRIVNPKKLNPLVTGTIWVFSGLSWSPRCCNHA